MKITSVLIFLLIIYGCSTKKAHIGPILEDNNSPIPMENLLKIEPDDNVTDFVESMPENPLIRSGVTHFLKSNPEKIIEKDVIDFEIFDGTLSVLKKDLIKFYGTSCNSILNKQQLTNIYIRQQYLFGESENFIVVYDVKNCGEILRISKGGYFFSSGTGKFVLYQNREFKILNIDGSEYLRGNLFKKIKDAHLTDNYLFLLDVENNFVGVDITQKIMLPSQKIVSGNIHFGRDNLFAQKGEKISLYNYENISYPSHSYDVENCRMNGYNSFCVNLKKEHEWNKIIKYDNYLVIKSKDFLKSVKLNEKSHKKIISLSKYIPKACRMDNQIIFFDIDKTIKSIDLSNYSLKIISENVKCENPLFYRRGEFYDKTVPVLTIGEIVNKDEKDLMIMRKIDENNIYIFFETIGGDF